MPGTYHTNSHDINPSYTTTRNKLPLPRTVEVNVRSQQTQTGNLPVDLTVYQQIPLGDEDSNAVSEEANRDCLSTQK